MDKMTEEREKKRTEKIGGSLKMEKRNEKRRVEIVGKNKEKGNLAL